MDSEGVEAVARQFHETYERLAPQFSYETRKASAVPWDDVPENNRRLMIATVAEVLASLPRIAVLEEALRALTASCTRTPVGGGDGGTYVVSAPTSEALRKARAALNGDSHEG